VGEILSLLKLSGGFLPNTREPAFTSTVLAVSGVLQELCKSHCWLNSQSVVEGGGKAEATFSIANKNQKYALISCIVLFSWKQTWDRDRRFIIFVTCVKMDVLNPPN